MVLEYDGRQWQGIRHLPLASIISPQFMRFRDDKSANATDVGLSQLTRITDIPATDAPLSETRLPASTLLRCAVAMTELKGRTMVRKLILWKANKETVSPEHPAYVIALTDFSPNRKPHLNAISACRRTWSRSRPIGRSGRLSSSSKVGWSSKHASASAIQPEAIAKAT
jgi:hypothetical protein